MLLILKKIINSVSNVNPSIKIQHFCFVWTSFKHNIKQWERFMKTNLPNIRFLLGCTFKCYDQGQSNFITIVTIMQIKVEQHLASKYILLGTCFFLLFSCCFNIIGFWKYHPEIQKIWPMTWIFHLNRLGTWLGPYHRVDSEVTHTWFLAAI